MSKIIEFIKSIPQQLKERWAWVVGAIFTWLLPVYLLSQEFAFTEEVSAGTKWTAAGIITAVVLFMFFRKWLYAKIVAMSHSVWRGIWLLLNRAISYGLVFGVLWVITTFAGKMLVWWKISGIVIAIGAIFYIIDELLFNVRANAVENNEEGGLTDENENDTI